MKSAVIVKNLLQKRDTSQAKVAKLIGYKTSQNLSKKLNQEHLETQLIEQISKAINHNIFYDLALELEKEDGLKIPRKNDTKTVFVDDAIIDLLKEKFPNLFK